MREWRVGYNRGLLVAVTFFSFLVFGCRAFRLKESAKSFSVMYVRKKTYTEP